MPGRPMSKPHAKWKPKLNEEERKSTWKEAAGDDKSLGQHKDARATFTRNANEDAALKKNGIGLTKEDDTVLKTTQVRLSNKKAAKGVLRKTPETRAKKNADKRAYLDKSGNREKNNTLNRACYKAKTDALQAERAADSEAKGVGVTTEFGLVTLRGGTNSNVEHITS